MTAPVETGKVSVSLQRLRYLERDSEECGELKRQLSEVKRERDFLRSRFTRKIVCLCGSTRFYRTFRDFNKRLTLQGIIVLSIGCEHHSDDELGITDEQKIELDELHKCKIDLADEVFILDVGGYIGSSTRSEIEYAESRGKPIRYLSKEFPGYREPVDSKRGLEERVERERDSLKRQTEHLERMVEVAIGILDAFGACPMRAECQRSQTVIRDRTAECKACLRDYVSQKAKEGAK